MGRDPKLVSAYLGRWHRTGLAKWRPYRRNRRGRPAYMYRLSRRGREHLRWLNQDDQREAEERIEELLRRDPAQVVWTPELELAAARLLRTMDGQLGGTLLEMRLTAFRAVAPGDWLAKHDYDWWTRPRRG